MKKELSNRYDMSVENMLDISRTDSGEFVITEGEFYSNDPKIKKPIKKKILTCDNKQIFAMVDGKFILEIEDDGICEYFWSNNLHDLL